MIPALFWFSISGGSLENAKALGRNLAEGSLVSFSSGHGEPTFVSGIGPTPLEKLRGYRYIHVVVPSAVELVGDKNSFVPNLRHQLQQMPSSWVGKAPVGQYVWVPTGKSDLLRTFYGPLVAQAAREAGAQVVAQEPSISFAETFADLAQDQSQARHAWHLVQTDSEQIDEGPALAAIDGKNDTYWHTRYAPSLAPYPHQLTVDMARAQGIRGFRYVPRQDGGVNGRVKGYRFETSADGVHWTEMSRGNLPDTPSACRVQFSQKVLARFFRFVATSEQNGGPWASAAEIDVILSH